MKNSLKIRFIKNTKIFGFSFSSRVKILDFVYFKYLETKKNYQNIFKFFITFIINVLCLYDYYFYFFKRYITNKNNFFNNKIYCNSVGLSFNNFDIFLLNIKNILNYFKGFRYNVFILNINNILISSKLFLVLNLLNFIKCMFYNYKISFYIGFRIFFINILNFLNGYIKSITI